MNDLLGIVARTCQEFSEFQTLAKAHWLLKGGGPPKHENGWGSPSTLKTYENIKTMSMLYLLCWEKKCSNMYVHLELVAFTEHKKKSEKKKFFPGMGPPWRVGPVDLVTQVSMVVWLLLQWGLPIQNHLRVVCIKILWLPHSYPSNHEANG